MGFLLPSSSNCKPYCINGVCQNILTYVNANCLSRVCMSPSTKAFLMISVTLDICSGVKSEYLSIF
nr:MAG TPA: hypothetical protein [Caudoviricetes sp.]